MNYLSYAGLTALRALRVRADVVITMTDPPIVGLLGALTSVLRGIPFVYNIQDLHPEMALASGMIRESPLVRVWDKFHLFALSRAEIVITPGSDMRGRVVAKGIAPHKVKVVRHGTEPALCWPDRDDPLVRELRQGFRFTLVHAGNLGFYGAWKTVIDAVRRMGSKGVGLVFVGTGAAEKSVRELAAHCGNVRFLPFRPAAQVSHVMASGDLQVVTMRKGLEGLVVPSKLYTILACGRPVLVVADEGSDAARLVKEFECGLVVPPDDPDRVCEAVNLAMSDPKRLESMSRQALKLSAHLKREQQLQIFVETVRSVTTKIK